MQSIDDWGVKIKQWLDETVGEWGIVTIVFLVAIGSFGLGKLSAIESVRPLVSIIQAPSATAPRAMPPGGMFVAAKTGSVYYYPWCTGASKILPQNQVWFANEKAAVQAGYAPAKNCKGLGN